MKSEVLDIHLDENEDYENWINKLREGNSTDGQ